MGLFQIVLQRPGEAPRVTEIPRTPWVIGRASSAGLCLTGHGIFDQHLTVRSHPEEGWIIEVGDGALARLGGRPFQRHRLRNGDVIDVGNHLLRFVLAPVRRKSLTVWTFFFWLLLGAVIAAQAVMLLRLAAP